MREKRRERSRGEGEEEGNQGVREKRREIEG